jgi:hypothetical protein
MILKYDPQKWHTCKNFKQKNCPDEINCYSYVLNNPNYYWSVPGLGFAHEQFDKYVSVFSEHFNKMSFEDFRNTLINGASKDGLIKTDETTEKEGYYLAALFFPREEKDFHWYRKDDNGYWSHKDGQKPALNQNKKKKLITDPIEDAKALYPIFGGYFLVPREGITLEETFMKLE